MQKNYRFKVNFLKFLQLDIKYNMLKKLISIILKSTK